MMSECRDMAIQYQNNGKNNMSEVMKMAALGYEYSLKNSDYDDLIQEINVNEDQTK